MSPPRRSIVINGLEEDVTTFRAATLVRPGTPELIRIVHIIINPWKCHNFLPDLDHKS